MYCAVCQSDTLPSGRADLEANRPLVRIPPPAVHALEEDYLRQTRNARKVYERPSSKSSKKNSENMSLAFCRCEFRIGRAGNLVPPPSFRILVKNFVDVLQTSWRTSCARLALTGTVATPKSRKCDWHHK